MCKTSSYIPDSMTMLGQQRQMVVPLADGWCWAYNVRPTLGHCDSVSEESHPYIGWEDIVGPTLGQCNRVSHKPQQYVGWGRLFGQRWANMLT